MSGHVGVLRQKKHYIVFWSGCALFAPGSLLMEPLELRVCGLSSGPCSKPLKLHPTQNSPTLACSSQISVLSSTKRGVRENFQNGSKQFCQCIIKLFKRLWNERRWQHVAKFKLLHKAVWCCVSDKVSTTQLSHCGRKPLLWPQDAGWAPSWRWVRGVQQSSGWALGCTPSSRSGGRDRMVWWGSARRHGDLCQCLTDLLVLRSEPSSCVVRRRTLRKRMAAMASQSPQSFPPTDWTPGMQASLCHLLPHFFVGQVVHWRLKMNYIVWTWQKYTTCCSNYIYIYIYVK